MKDMILIIEDDDNLREILKETLEEENYQIVEAKNITEAKKKFRHHIFKCILLDLVLPDGEGTDFLQYIRNKKIDIPIVILTAHPSLQSAIKGVKYDAFDYIEKPYKEKELINIINNAISKNKLADEKEFEFIELDNYRKKLEKEFEQKINELRELENKYRELVGNIYLSNIKEPETQKIEARFKLKDMIKIFAEDRDLNPAKFAKIHLSCMMKIICLNHFCKHQKGITCQCSAPVLLLGCNFRYTCYNFYPKVKKEASNLSSEDYFEYIRSKEFKTELQWMNFLESFEKSILSCKHKFI